MGSETFVERYFQGTYVVPLKDLLSLIVSYYQVHLVRSRVRGAITHARVVPEELYQ